MSFIVRRINRAKWEKPMPNVDADAITNCIKTHQNTLSVWEISGIDKLDEAILALVSGSKQTHLSTLNIIHFEENVLLQNSIEYIKDSATADTIIDDLKQSHIDIVNLTYTSLGNVGNIIQDCINNAKVATISKRTILQLLAKATIEQRFDINNMHEDFINNENKALQKEIERLNNNKVVK
jgi:hypothetical protein